MTEVTDPPARAGDPEGDQPREAALNGELDRLADAVAQRRPEPICAAYKALRRRADGRTLRELFAAADAVAGREVLPVVLSAFSHLHDLLCTDGTEPCDACDGAGTVGGEPCGTCRGLGMHPCGLCAGTGWADREEIPRELLPAVVRKQLAHLREELIRLDKALRQLEGADVADLPVETRRRLIAWVMRLRARASDLAGREELSAANRRELQRRAARLAAVLDRLRH